MIHFSNDLVRRRLQWPALFSAIERAVSEGGTESPQRTQYLLQGSGQEAGHLLIMTSWRRDEVLGIKTVTYWPNRGQSDIPALGANYILIDAQSGTLLATFAAEELTARRTAAVSVIAARRLARQNARKVLIIGTGPVACALAEAYSASIGDVELVLHGRSAAKADAAIAFLRGNGIECARCESLSDAVTTADIISTATSSREALFDGGLVSPGTHVDLVGSFTPEMREVDGKLLSRANSVWVDTNVALEEAGDIVQPLAEGDLERSIIRGDLRQLLATRIARGEEDITVFKSVGFAVPDLAAAELVLKAQGSASTN